MDNDPPFNPLRYPIAMQQPAWLTESSGWVAHIPFAMALVQMLQPRSIVELGAYRGDAYCAFCQAVAKLGLATRCFAVDNWSQGDPHVGPLEEQILVRLRAHHDPRYGQFSELMQLDFDQAATRFGPGCIDLLHIDGTHAYEAVRHDFETWLPKLTDRAVVLFHDTQIRWEGFGVWKLWQEISSAHPSFEFHHSAGLGVLGLGSDLPEAFKRFIAEANATPELVRTHFFTIGHRIEMMRISNVLVRGMRQVHDAISAIEAQPALPPPNVDVVRFADQVVAEVKSVCGKRDPAG